MAVGTEIRVWRWYHKLSCATSGILAACACLQAVLTLVVAIVHGAHVFETLQRVWDLHCLLLAASSVTGLWAFRPGAAGQGAALFPLVACCFVFSSLAVMATTTVLSLHAVMLHQMLNRSRHHEASMLSPNTDSRSESLLVLSALIVVDSISFCSAAIMTFGCCLYIFHVTRQNKRASKPLVLKVTPLRDPESKRNRASTPVDGHQTTTEDKDGFPQGTIVSTASVSLENATVVTLPRHPGTIYSLPEGSLVMLER